MHRSFTMGLVLGAVLVTASPRCTLDAQQTTVDRQPTAESPRAARAAARRKIREARRFRRVKVDGETVQTRVRQLAQLRWYSSLAKAKSAARQQRKLVLWIHALGRIDGFL